MPLHPDDKQRAAAYRRDLQRLIAMSFSAGELSKYAERWRVFTDREGGSEGGARALVRALEGRDKLAGLVESLRAHKPLVEWPEPPPQPTIPQTPVIVEPEAHERVREDDLGLLAMEDIEDDEDDDDEEESTQHSIPPPPPRSRTDRSRGEPLIDPFMEAESERHPKALGFRRWLPSVATGLAGIAIGATAMYLLHPERKTKRGVPAAVAEVAADHMRSRVQAVAEACQVPFDGDSARDVLGVAFAECGVPEVRERRKLPGAQPTLPRSTSPPQTGPTPFPQARARPRPGKKSPSGAACLDGCHESYTTCAKARCGSEPQSAAENAAWSRCLHDCQSRRMRCRLSCR